MELKKIPKYSTGPGRVFMTALILLIAVTVVQIFVMGAIEMFAYAKRSAATKGEPPKTEEEKRIHRIRQTSKQCLPDGTIHLVYEPRTEQGRIVEPRTEQIYDTNDNLLWEGLKDQSSYEYLSWAQQPRRYSEAFWLMQIKELQMLTPVFSRTIEVPIGSANNIEQIWRYRPGAECFEGYNVGGGRIGYIGAAGFSDSASKAEPFGECRFFTAWCPQDSSSPVLLWQTARRIYQINFEKRQTELIFESADSDIERIDLHAWRGLKPGTEDYVDPVKYRPLLVCITQDGIHHLILREPDQRLRFPGPRCSLTATRQSIYALRHGSDMVPLPSMITSAELYTVWKEWVEKYRDKPQKRWIELYRVSDDGGLELVNRYDWTEPPFPERFAEVEPMLATQRLVGTLSPPLYNVIFHVLGKELWSYARQPANRGSFFYGFLLQMPLWLRPLNNPLNWLLSALMMGFVFWHGWPRRTSSVRFAFWLVFVGLLNVTGLLTYLALNHTAVIRCPACGRRRGLAQSDCVHCQAPLPTPKPRELDLVLKSCC